jgi:DNA-binding response OmpR family regulator
MTNPVAQPHILLMEDDDDFRQLLADGLESVGFSVTQAARSDQIMTGGLGDPINAAVIDMSLEDGPCAAAIRYLRAHPQHATAKLIVMSGYDYAQKGAKAWGADLFLKKPISFERLLEALATLGVLPSPT